MAIEALVEKQTPIKKKKAKGYPKSVYKSKEWKEKGWSDRPKKNPVTGEYDDKLETMKTRAELQAKSNKRKKRTYKGDNPAGIRVSVSSKGTYKTKTKDMGDLITHTDSKTRYGKEKLDKKGREYQDFRERSKRRTDAKNLGSVSDGIKGSGRAYTGRKARKRKEKVSGTHLYGDWLKD